jgi:hypothetical protein
MNRIDIIVEIFRAAEISRHGGLIHQGGEAKEVLNQGKGGAGGRHRVSKVP